MNEPLHSKEKPTNPKNKLVSLKKQMQTFHISFLISHIFIFEILSIDCENDLVKCIFFFSWTVFHSFQTLVHIPRYEASEYHENGLVFCPHFLAIMYARSALMWLLLSTSLGKPYTSCIKLSQTRILGFAPYKHTKWVLEKVTSKAATPSFCGRYSRLLLTVWPL